VSLVKNSAVRDYISARRRKIVFPFAPASQQDATGYPENEARDVNMSNAHRESGQAPSFETASITPIGVLINSDGPVDSSTVRKLQA
jgi:hypothetical protein